MLHHQESNQTASSAAAAVHCEARCSSATRHIMPCGSVSCGFKPNYQLHMQALQCHLTASPGHQELLQCAVQRTAAAQHHTSCADAVCREAHSTVCLVLIGILRLMLRNRSYACGGCCITSHTHTASAAKQSTLWPGRPTAAAVKQASCMWQLLLHNRPQEHCTPCTSSPHWA